LYLKTVIYFPKPSLSHLPGGKPSDTANSPRQQRHKNNTSQASGMLSLMEGQTDLTEATTSFHTVTSQRTVFHLQSESYFQSLTFISL